MTDWSHVYEPMSKKKCFSFVKNYSGDFFAQHIFSKNGQKPFKIEKNLKFNVPVERILATLAENLSPPRLFLFESRLLKQSCSE